MARLNQHRLKLGNPARLLNSSRHPAAAKLRPRDPCRFLQLNRFIPTHRRGTFFLQGETPCYPPSPTAMPYFLKGLIPLTARSHVTSMSRATSSDVLSDGLPESHPSSASSQAGGYADAQGSAKQTPRARKGVIAAGPQREMKRLSNPHQSHIN